MCLGPNQAVVDCNAENVVTIAQWSIREEAKTTALGAIVMVLTVIVMLMFLTFVFNMETTKFSNNCLQPLRRLTDDMVALSAVQLMHTPVMVEANTNIVP